jgi:hypothetical protein
MAAGVKSLSDHEKDIVLECLLFISQGGFFDMETDCFIRIGVSVEAFQKVISLWPEINDDVEGSDSFLVVNNSLNELCYGPDSPSKKDWAKYFNASRDDIARSYKKWAESLER